MHVLTLWKIEVRSTGCLRSTCMVTLTNKWRKRWDASNQYIKLGFSGRFPSVSIYVLYSRMSYMVSEIMGGEIDDTNSDLSDARFLTKGAFLLTPSHDLSLDKAANICDKLNFKGSFSLTKTATGILFKFSEPEDYQQVYRKGFHKVTGGRLYRKVAIPCRPQKTFSLLVNEVPLDLPEDDISYTEKSPFHLPEDDIRASLFRYTSVVEVIRVPPKVDQIPGTPNPIRITVASLDEYNNLLQQGLDFYGATYFPTEPFKKDSIRGSKEIMPVFDAAGFSRIPPPASRLLKPRSN
ncbi:hypothetical protein QE152_g1516 [Popillia japonica]|uniref:Uncharacterized protein n=1 Tax=Popillia japonica TaxID=7064 RepID=A0AAW1N474_POPJA